MATPIVMPRLGDFMTEGVVTRFTKAQGCLLYTSPSPRD